MASSLHRGVEVLQAQLRTMPEKPGVYRMLAQDGAVLYVGKAKNLKNRVRSYTQIARLPVRLQRMVARVRGMEIVTTATEVEALLLEANLIKRFAPPYNILLRDDKSFPFLLLTQDHPFPRLMKHRGAKIHKGLYFGPFASGAAVTETMEQLARAFRLRPCADTFFAQRTRPCLQYHIKRCTAPCVGRVTEEAYRRQVEEACLFLRGDSRALQARLADDMQAASDALDFERAAALRDRIKALTSIQAQQDIHVAGLGDADVVALHHEGGASAVQVFFYRAGRNYGARVYFPAHDSEAESAAILGAFLAQFYEDKDPPPLLLLSEMPAGADLLAAALTEKAERKVQLAVPKQEVKRRLVEAARANAAQALARKKAETSEQKKMLAAVAQLFGLSQPPARIEVYDNSHISGAFAVGAMIAAGAEGFLKKTYRKFNIKTAKGGDDFAMMEEVLTRRFKRLVQEDPARTSGLWPDLLLIDGGQGQVAKGREVLAALGVTGVGLVGIAKGVDRNAGREHFILEGRAPFQLPPQDPVLYYLQRLRDEAHRFAIGTHRARRIKAIGQSGLEEIGGIGAARKRALLRVFGSARAVAQAGLEDLARTQGISRALARKIYDYFHSEG